MGVDLRDFQSYKRDPSRCKILFWNALVVETDFLEESRFLDCSKGKTMRIQLKLSVTGPNRTLPLNSNYFQSALIYRIINSASSEYSKFLH
ncbi:MAG: hypothetical protein ACE5HO_21670, partial [bacterium]